jgi:chemotaxis signal transduction protein
VVTDTPKLSTFEQLKQEILGQSQDLVEGNLDNITDRRDSGLFVHVFVAGGDGYMIPAETPAVLVQIDNARRLPFAAPWFEGLIHYRGDLIPLFDLSRFFAPEGPKCKGSYLLVIGHGDEKAALRVEEVTALPADAAVEENRDSERKFVKRIHEINGKSYRELDLQGLFKAMAGRAVAESAS